MKCYFIQLDYFSELNMLSFKDTILIKISVTVYVFLPARKFPTRIGTDKH